MNSVGWPTDRDGTTSLHRRDLDAILVSAELPWIRIDGGALDALSSGDSRPLIRQMAVVLFPALFTRSC